MGDGWPRVRKHAAAKLWGNNDAVGASYESNWQEGAQEGYAAWGYGT